MKLLIDWIIFFTLLLVLNAIAVRFLDMFNRPDIKKFDFKLYIKDLGVLYFHPYNKG